MKATDAITKIEDLITRLTEVNEVIEDNDTYDFPIDALLKGIDERVDELEVLVDNIQ